MKIHALFGTLLFLLLADSASAQPVPGLGCTPGAHTFCVTTTADSGAGSLRQAITDSNTAGGANTIGFQIPGTGPQTITLTSQLPAINANGTLTSLLIDGYSQPGSVLNTNTPDQGGLNAKLMIEITGTGGFYGFFYNCCANPYVTLTLQGLNLHGFLSAILGQTYGFAAKAKWNIYGNFIGTTLDGTAAAAPLGHAGQGVGIEYDDAQIGGAQAWQRNLISGNGYGINAGTPNAAIVVEGNLIGTDVSGTTAIPNDPAGLNLSGNFAGLRIGCTGAGCVAPGHPSRNFIAGNYSYGMLVDDGLNANYAGSGAQIKGNYIGVDVTGTKPLPNGNAGSIGGCPAYCAGITVRGSGSGSALVVGGFDPGEGNVIAYNGGPGIAGYDNGGYPSVGASFDNQGNALHNNGSTDIAFTEYGWIANDPGDADPSTGYSKPNNEQNYPVIASANVAGGMLNATYAVDSLPANATYPLRIDFYVAIGEGSGEYLASDSYAASDATLPKTVSLSLPADAQSPAGILVTATDANGYTSEISPSYVFDRIFSDRFEGH